MTKIYWMHHCIDLHEIITNSELFSTQQATQEFREQILRVKGDNNIPFILVGFSRDLLKLTPL